MKNKNFILTLCASVLICVGAIAQNTAGKIEDMGRLTIAPYIPEQTDQLPDAARSMLTNKLSQIVTQNGLSGNAFNERFIITANIVTLNKDLIASAPPMTALSMEITFHIGDGFDGTKFASKSVTVKGVGTNETKAYIEGIKMVKPSDPSLAALVEEGKTRIIKYYNTKCDFIIKEAQTLATQNKHDEAIFKLVTIPDVCKECFDKGMTAVAPIYKQKIDRECQMKLSEANNIWNANQNIDAANAAGEILSTIEPQAACYKEIQALANKISKHVTEIDKREWKYKLKTQEQTSELIRAYRDVGVAYGNGQPKSIVYNVRGWW